MTARRQALEELERDRVGLAPGAAALLAAREQFDGGVLGPLSDFVSTARKDAELAERLLGDWMHAVLVRDGAAVSAIQAWHAEHQPGALVLLPLDSGPLTATDDARLDDRLRAEGPAAAWVRAALAGSEVLDGSGLVLRRASGAIFLSGAGAPPAPCAAARSWPSWCRKPTGASMLSSPRRAPYRRHRRGWSSWRSC